LDSTGCFQNINPLDGNMSSPDKKSALDSPGSMAEFVTKSLTEISNWEQDAETFKKMVEHMPVIVYVYHWPKVIYVNPYFEQFTGYSLQEMQQKNFWDVCHPDQHAKIRANGYARLHGQPAPNNYELSLVKKNGEVIWLNVFFVVTTLSGESTSIVVCFDITESKRLKEELQTARDELELRVAQRTEELSRANRELIYSNQNLNNILNNLSDRVIVFNRQGNLEIFNSFCSHAAEAFTAEAKSKLTNLFLSAKNMFVRRIFEEKAPFRDEEIILSTSQGTLQFLASGTPMLDENGEVGKGLLILRPIQEIHRLVNRFTGARASFQFPDIITNDSMMLELIERAKLAAQSMSSVIIEGESGTGKELFAQSIHNFSSRNKGPFVAVNCGAIPRELIGSELFGYVEGAFTGAKKGGQTGKFELASGGTLFLDEIADMPFEQQATLLRVLQEKKVSRIGGNQMIPVDVRIICATNKDINIEMKRENFRRDLYYRLNVINLKIPTLRERSTDVIRLFNHFLKMSVQQVNKNIKSVAPEILNYLIAYSWPGNVRELQNLVERMLNTAMSDNIGINQLPDEIRNPQVSPATEKNVPPTTNKAISIKDFRDMNKRKEIEEEKKCLLELLQKNKGNIKQTAIDLGFSRTTLYKKMQRYQISE
jgi:sigma-54 dependent transcriptional regulator, acetoin dehydrogenase operon transcriptional activator AcoR